MYSKTCGRRLLQNIKPCAHRVRGSACRAWRRSARERSRRASRRARARGPRGRQRSGPPAPPAPTGTLPVGPRRAQWGLDRKWECARERRARRTPARRGNRRRDLRAPARTQAEIQRENQWANNRGIDTNWEKKKQFKLKPRWDQVRSSQSEVPINLLGHSKGNRCEGSH